VAYGMDNQTLSHRMHDPNNAIETRVCNLQHRTPNGVQHFYRSQYYKHFTPNGVLLR